MFYGGGVKRYSWRFSPPSPYLALPLLLSQSLPSNYRIPSNNILLHISLIKFIYSLTYLLSSLFANLLIGQLIFLKKCADIDDKVVQCKCSLCMIGLAKRNCWTVSMHRGLGYMYNLSHVIRAYMTSLHTAVTSCCFLCFSARFLPRNAFVGWNRRAIAMMFVCLSVRPSVCLERACILIIRCTWARILVYNWIVQCSGQWHPGTKACPTILSAVFFQFHLEERWV